MKRKHFYFVLLFCLFSITAFAEGIPIEPGRWEMTSTVNMPMLPQPRVSTDIECIHESELSPEAMTEEGMDSSCSFDTIMVDGNTMKWSMDCALEQGGSHGEWEVTSHGDSLSGDGTVTIDVQGQAMVMTMVWEGKRLGACD
jgi:hypothetical protein